MLPLTAMAEVPRVITDIAPVYGLVAQVMGDLGQPVLLLDKGAGAHDFQLRPSQMSSIASTDLAVWIGPKLTPWFERALEGAKSDLASLVLLEVGGTHKKEFAATGGHDAQGDDHDAAGHDDHDHKEAGRDDHGHEESHAHDHSGTDPHAWLNPENAAPWLDAIAAELAKRDPDNAAIYAANAAAAKAEIAALDAELAAALAPVKDKGFVAYHDAYGYFAAHYGLAYKGAVAMGDATTAGAAHLREMQEKLAGGVVCVFPEGQHDSSLLLQLIDGTPAKAGAALDPEGATLDASPSSYADVLRNLAAALTGCLSGA
ncbi:MAG: zinc ABC transporter substrate-binding protein [Cypionkella sp.]|nr:zinc ABC transporter substrate-binding protein [Cypionkella sp.]